MWLRDCWYVIAWDHEIPAAGAGDLFSRTVLGEPILVFRCEDGALAALEDRCCHRLAPLSKGRREGDCVRCGYHGLMFDADGRCVDAACPPSPPRRGCAATRWSPIVAGCSSGWAIRHGPIGNCCPTTSPATTRSGSTGRATCTTRRRTC